MTAVYEGYWILVCNPKRSNVSQILYSTDVKDYWHVDSRHAQHFKPGQLAFIRVGVDQRNRLERAGKPKLEPGIYALCEIASDASPLADDIAIQFKNFPRDSLVVRIRYLFRFAETPLLIEQLKSEVPELDRNVLRGLQARSFSISRSTFDRLAAAFDICDRIATKIDMPPSPSSQQELAALEQKYATAAPIVRDIVSVRIERSAIGNHVKRLNGYRCQICDAIGSDARSFKTARGEWYVEAHHVMPLSRGGADSLTNVIAVCANHHRQLHYGKISYSADQSTLNFDIDGRVIRLRKAVL